MGLGVVLRSHILTSEGKPGVERLLVGQQSFSSNALSLLSAEVPSVGSISGSPIHLPSLPNPPSPRKGASVKW